MCVCVCVCACACACACVCVCVCACVQVASWLDSSVSPVVNVVEQVAHTPSELAGETVLQLRSSNLFSAVITTSHKIYWW